MDYSIFLILIATVSFGTVFLKRIQYRKQISEAKSIVAELDRQRDDFIRECKERGIEIPEFMK
jgi:hypothetical protein